jgi:hypothetical protein
VERATGSGVGHGEQHAAGAGLGGIMRAVDSWLNRNEFSKPGGARLEVMVDLGKSARIWCRVGERRIRWGPASARNASCNRLKSPREPGSAMDMEWSSPRMRCHFVMDILR